MAQLFRSAVFWTKVACFWRSNKKVFVILWSETPQIPQMNGEKQTSNKSVEIFSRYLVSTGRRQTQERFIILDCAATLCGHFTADDILTRLKNSNIPVAVGTVYSTLQLLCECGLLCRSRFDDGKMRFENASASHLHLHCSKCGAIEDVHDSELETLLSHRSYQSFEVSSYSLTFTGLCKACRRKRRPRAKNKQQNTLTTTNNKPKRK